MFFYICSRLKGKRTLFYAKVAQLVEHDLAKVGVAGSNPVFRSELIYNLCHFCPGGGTGRHAGLKILCSLERAGSSPARGTNKKGVSNLI